MATYYRWRKSALKEVLSLSNTYNSNAFFGVGEIPPITVYFSSSYTIKTGIITLTNPSSEALQTSQGWSTGNYYFMFGASSASSVYKGSNAAINPYNVEPYPNRWRVHSGTVYRYTTKTESGEVVGYVYSTSPNAYPNSGVAGSYYYDQRTTITSPTAPTGLTYPNPITTPKVAVSWDAATSNVPSYSIHQYELSYSADGGKTWPWTSMSAQTSTTTLVPAGATTLQIRIRAQDTNGAWSDYTTGENVTILLAPTITVPSLAMQGQDITVNWTAVDTATSYTLQRKSDTDDDWVEMYSGSNLTFTETVGTWTTVKYQVQAVFSSGAGAWATSANIPVVSASALVISGQDGDLGTLTKDVPYTVSSDTGNPITLTRTVNGVLVASLTVENGFAYNIPVMDLPTGTGTIVISATVQASGGPVSASRTWTYTKAAFSFPGTGSTAQLQKEGKNVFPATLAECVRAGKLWGGSLDKALEMLGNAVTYTATAQPKYSEVSIDLSSLQEGDIVPIPRNGVMVPHYVGKINYEEALNGSGRTLLVPATPYPYADAWDAGNVNAYAFSDIDTWMNSTYKEMFPKEIQDAMGTTKFYYTPGNGNTDVTTLSRSVFLLSVSEFGANSYGSGPIPNIEGSVLPIASKIRIAYLDGQKVWQWTRTPANSNSISAFWLEAQTGKYSSGGQGVKTNGGYGLHSFTLPSTFSATYFVDGVGNIYAEQEYTTAGDFADLWGNTIPVPKIETGSYVGTGTYGSSTPNTLTFSFEPKIVFIALDTDYNGTCVPMIRASKSAASIIASAGYLISLSWNEKSVSWYGATAQSQLNLSNKTYFYVCIG